MNPILFALLFFLFLFWAYLVYGFLKRKKITVAKTFVPSGNVDVIAKGSNLVDLPTSFTITIVEDVPVRMEGLADISINMSSLINGTYRFPKKYLKDYDPISDFDPPEEKTPYLFAMDVSSVEIDPDYSISTFFKRVS